MEAYGDFAQVYDLLMDDIPYGQWCDFVTETLQKNGIQDGIVLDLGCGTGAITERLARRGYDMIGIDQSDRMLDMAVKKREASGLDILYLQQDMRDFELYGTVRAAICLCDSLNYLLEEEEICQCFRLVNNYLDPGGIFLFDFNTVYKYETVIADAVIAENREDCSFIWENYFDKTSSVNEYDLTFFVRKEGDLFSRFTETHLQRGYTPAQMRRLLEEAGLTFLTALDADTHAKPTKESQRIYMLAKEKGKSL